MKKLPQNPFKFGDPVEGDFYLPRPELFSTVKQFLENRIHVVLMGPRRFGKTSFTLNLLHTLEKEGYTCLFVDIFNITSHKDFLHQLLRAIRLKSSFKDKLKNWWKKVGQLVPKIVANIDSFSGSPNIEFSLSLLTEEDVKTAIQDLLEGLEGLGKKVIITLDEFQKISEIHDKGWLEATLRTHFQRLKNVSFLFTGSRKSLISEMLNDPSRPFYRSCQTIEFPAFGSEFTDWVIKRFATIGIQCEKEAIIRLRQLVQDTPNYVQMVCFHLVAAALPKIEQHNVEEVLETVTRQNAYAYQTLLNSLTHAQQRSLRLAANEKESLFQKENLTKYEIVSSAALHSSLKALKTKGILDEESSGKGNVLFDDPLFAYWLRIYLGRD
ncbi:MAG: ATP-binding protein [Candidatus Algichlamydia australiensis]|nr:ATP-binding protein [Chlamydiales bacterium]